MEEEAPKTAKKQAIGRRSSQKQDENNNYTNNNNLSNNNSNQSFADESNLQDDVMEIREQFPLPLEETEAIAEYYGLQHPSHRGNFYMSDDFEPELFICV